MADRQAQEFWDKMWYWERYESYPDEQTDDPHLVVGLSARVEDAGEAGQEPDPELMRRYDHCVGRVLARLTDLFPRSGADVDLAELANWLRFGLDGAHRGHDEAITPIIDADSLVIFLFFTKHAIMYCDRHGLTDLQALWTSVQATAQGVEAEHQGARRPSRFDPPA